MEASVTPTASGSANEGQNSAQSEASVKESAQSGATATGKEVKAAEAAAVKRIREQDFDSIVTVKINGEIKEMPLRDVVKLNQLEGASQAKMQEAAKMMKQVQQIVHLAKTNPKAFLKETGIDPYDFAESTLAEKFEMMQMTPEQKELLEYKNRLKSYEEREKEQKDAQEKEYSSRIEQQESVKLDKELGDAWKESGLPSTKFYVTQIAARMLSASKQGKPLTAKEAAASVKSEFMTSTRDTLSAMDAEAIHEMLGKDVMKKIREYDVKRVTGKTASQQKPGPGANPASDAKKAYKSEHEWREEISRMTAHLTD